MKHLAHPIGVLALLLASSLVVAGENWGQPLAVFDLAHTAARMATDADFGRPGDAWRALGFHDGDRVELGRGEGVARLAGARTPTEVFGTAGYAVYDFDTWALVSAVTIGGPFRGRSYVRLGSGLYDYALNALTLRSGDTRRGIGLRADFQSWPGYPGWRF